MALGDIPDRANGQKVLADWFNDLRDEAEGDIAGVSAGLGVSYGLASSASAGALTVELKNSLGNDPDTSTTATIRFRNTSITSGITSLQTFDAAESIVVTSNATLGYANGDDAYVFVYAYYDGTNKGLAVSSITHDESKLHSISTMNAGSDSAGLYATTSRTGAAVALLGRVLVDSITTAGTWTTPDELTTDTSTSSLSRVGEYIQTEITTAISSASADTYVSTSESIKLTPGRWRLGYNFFTRIDYVGATGVAVGNVRLATSGGTEVPKTLAGVLLTLAVNTFAGWTTSSEVVVVITETTSYVGEVRAGAADTAYKVTIDDETVSGTLTDDDNTSTIYAERMPDY